MHKNLLSYLKMGKEILTFGNIEIKKNKFYHNKSIFFKDEDIEKILVSNKISFGEKNYTYFIGYLCNDGEVKPLNIMLPKTSTYVKRYDRQTKWMHFLIKDDDLLKNITLIGIKSVLISKKNLIMSLSIIKPF